MISKKYFKRQDNIIFISVRMLINLYEDGTVERKMIIKNLLSLLYNVLVLNNQSTKSKGCSILRKHAGDISTLTTCHI